MALRKYPPTVIKRAPKQAPDNNSKPETDTQPAKLAQPATEQPDQTNRAIRDKDTPQNDEGTPQTEALAHDIVAEQDTHKKDDDKKENPEDEIDRDWKDVAAGAGSAAAGALLL